MEIREGVGVCAQESKKERKRRVKGCEHGGIQCVTSGGMKCTPLKILQFHQVPK